jgi:hypothetical protein
MYKTEGLRPSFYMGVGKNSTGFKVIEKRMIKGLARRISNIDYVRSAIDDQADLSTFKEKPTPRVIWGLVIVGISYLIGWPLIAALGIIAAYAGAPLILVIGGPVAYVMSHLVFILGACLAGAKYARTFFRWATRVAVEKVMGDGRLEMNDE